MVVCSLSKIVIITTTSANERPELVVSMVRYANTRHEDELRFGLYTQMHDTGAHTIWVSRTRGQAVDS